MEGDCMHPVSFIDVIKPNTQQVHIRNIVATVPTYKLSVGGVDT